jgi:hypothetical protein
VQLSARPERYPRVLHVGFTELGAANSAAITLLRAFGPWPEDRLLQLCIRPRSGTAGVIDARGPFSHLVDAGATQLLTTRRWPDSPTDDRPPTRPSLSRQTLRAIGDLRPVLPPRDVIGQITEFAPQVIHSPVWGMRVSRLCVQLSRRLDIPIVPHFMDDWPTTLHEGALMATSLRRRVLRTLQELMDRSPRLIVIGDQMAEEYVRRYSRQCDVVGNCVSESDMLVMRQQEPTLDDAFVYVGGLANRRSEVLEQVARNLPSGVRVRLYVNPKESAQAAELSRRCAQIEDAGSLSRAMVPQRLASAAALLFVEATDPRTLAYTQLSVSGKVPEYLMSGRPILAVGPTEQASIRALRQSPLTTVARDPSQVQEAARRTMAHAAARSSVEALVPVYGCEATQARLRESLRGAVEAVS